MKAYSFRNFEIYDKNAVLFIITFFQKREFFNVSRKILVDKTHKNNCELNNKNRSDTLWKKLSSVGFEKSFVSGNPFKSSCISCLIPQNIHQIIYTNNYNFFLNKTAHDMNQFFI